MTKIDQIQTLILNIPTIRGAVLDEDKIDFYRRDGGRRMKAVAGG